MEKNDLLKAVSINETPHLTRSSPQYNVLCMCGIRRKIKGTFRDTVTVCGRERWGREPYTIELVGKLGTF